MIYFDNCQDQIMLKTEWPTAFKMNNTTMTNSSLDINSPLDTYSYFISSASLMGLWVISLGAILFLYFYMNPIFKLRVSRFVFPCIRSVLFPLFYLLSLPVNILWIIVNIMFYMYNCVDLQQILEKFFDSCESLQDVFSPIIIVKKKLWHILKTLPYVGFVIFPILYISFSPMLLLWIITNIMFYLCIKIATKSPRYIDDCLSVLIACIFYRWKWRAIPEWEAAQRLQGQEQHWRRLYV